jgi:hypothetical protein
MLELVFDLLGWLFKRVRGAKIPDCSVILAEMQAGSRPGLNNDGYVLMSRLVFGAAILRASAAVGILLLGGWLGYHVDLHAHGFAFGGHDKYVLTSAFVEEETGQPNMRAIIGGDPAAVFFHLAVCEIVAWSFVSFIATSLIFFSFLLWLSKSFLGVGSAPPAPGTSPLGPAAVARLEGVVQS